MNEGGDRMRVLISDPISKKGIEILKAKGFEVELRDERNVCDIIENFDGVIVRSATKLTAEVIEKGKNLKVIGRAGIGLDNIDLDVAKKRNIKVINTPTATSISVAELVMGMMFALSRHLVNSTVSMREGKWEKKRFKGAELYGKTLGIIGLGNIGREIAKRCMALEMNAIVTRSHMELGCNIKGVKLVTLDELLKSSDIISVNVPLTENTKHMISKKEFEKMKDGVMLINCSRGGVVDEEALYENLVSSKVLGAGIDVYENEPPKDSPLLSLSNVVLTPHIGAQTREGQDRCGLEVAEKVVKELGE
jgi:D-3-phosphoglycerate dehydrogenase